MSYSANKAEYEKRTQRKAGWGWSTQRVRNELDQLFASQILQLLQDLHTQHHQAAEIASTITTESWCAPTQDPPRQQPHSATLEELYVQAEAAKLPFFHLLQSAEVLVNTDAAHRQAKPLVLKEQQRSREEIEKHYECQACRLLDIVQGSIICREFAEMDRIIEWLRTDTASHGASLIRVKSGFASYNYRGVKLTVQVVGHLCDLQLYLYELKMAEDNMTKIETLREISEVKADYARAFQVARRRFATATITSRTQGAPQSWCASGQDPPRQDPPSATLEELFVQAEASKQPFFRLLQLAEELVNADAAHRQAKPLELKELKRSEDKIKNDYGGRACRLLDIVRGSIICRDFEEMDRIIELLHAFLIRVKSGFAAEHAELTYGYRDVKLTVRVAGHLCELQLHLQSFYDIKNKRGHKLYKWAREFAMAGINHSNQIMKQSPEAMACMEELLVQRLLAKQPNFFVGWELGALQNILELQGKFETARAFRIVSVERSRALWPDSINLAVELNNFAQLLKQQGKYEEAQPLYEQSLAIRRRVYGEEHPAVATALNNLALLLSNLGQYEEARIFQEQALAIDRKVLGEEHPDVASDVNNLASLLRNTGWETEAYQLGRQALGIATRVLGVDHPTTRQFRRNWPPASNIAA